VTSAANRSGFIPPQQARSRAALERLLAAAEEVLATQGLDEFTIAAVAERAGVSVGGVYRRFTGKEQLLEAVIDRALGQLQTTITTALADAPPSISGVVTTFVQALAGYFARVGPMYAAIISGPHVEDNRERGLAAVTTVQRIFLDAALPYSAEIAHKAPSTALSTVLRTVLAAGVHRAAVIQWWPDGLSWTQWADEIADMTTTYLTTAEHAH
jgi:AcrR family transcriptional regulator